MNRRVIPEPRRCTTCGQATLGPRDFTERHRACPEIRAATADDLAPRPGPVGDVDTAGTPLAVDATLARGFRFAPWKSGGTGLRGGREMRRGAAIERDRDDARRAREKNERRP